MHTENPLFLIDFYKADHRSQYPDGTTLVYSNFTPRKSRVPGVNHMTFFGLQAAIRKYLMEDFTMGFFGRPRNVIVDEYQYVMNRTLGPGLIKTDHIAALHDLGYLPIQINAVKEGTNVPLQTPAFTIWNTHPDFFWLTNYLETLLSAVLWKPCTSATTAGNFKKVFNHFARATGGDLGFVPFQGHDFSFRGMSGVEDAQSSGAGHLLHFVGTDTLPAINWLRKYYNASLDDELIGCSVPATEHSVMCAGGEDGELQTIERLLRIYPKGILSVVSDTWDLFKLLDEYLPALKEQIMTRDGKLVIRPDSGTPNLIMNGNPDSHCELEKKGVLRILKEHFGGTTNEKGYFQLDPHIGTIYGDGIDTQELLRILDGMKKNGFASTNVVIGMGSYTYQYVTRDTLGTVCKATYVEVNGVGRPIYKTPKTGAWKKSHKGLLRVNPDLSVSEDVTWEEQGGMLEKVFKDGQLYRVESLKEIRERVAAQFN